MQELYTIICEYCGGTYIKQVVASDVSQALQQWMDWIRLSREVPLPVLEMESIAHTLRDLEPTPVQECQNVWSTAAFPPSGQIWINLIKTQAE